MRFLFLTFSLLLAFLLPNITMAEEHTENLVKIRILPERGQIKPGETLWIGIEQSIANHWHTYWQNPGDSGTAPSINWDLPEGFQVSDIIWPTPKKLPYGPLLNYGYEGRTILLQQLTAPDALPDGEITLNAEIDILVCKDECIPEYGTYTTTLNGPNARAEDNSAYIDAARMQLPGEDNWPVRFGEKDNDFILQTTIPKSLRNQINLASAAFIPKDWGLISNPATPEAFIRDQHLIIKQQRGERAITDLKTIEGLLIFKLNDGSDYSVKIAASPLIQETPQTKPAKAKAPKTSLNVITAILFALIGGLALNLMPCVFPVLSIKALSLVKIAEKHPDQARKHGIAYSAGVILSFMFIAGTLIILQASGAQIGWGFQLQNPLIVGALGYLLFVLGLNLIGFFEFSNPFGNVGGKLAQGNSLSGSFFTGILATLVATPCTAPFMAGAIGFALTQNPITSLSVFAALGFGLALPYLALSFIPALQKHMPKPGAWMEVFKQLLAFPMFLAALWLLWVLAQQSGIIAISAAVLGAIMISFGIWLFKHRPQKPALRITLSIIALTLFASAFMILPITSQPPISAEQHQGEFSQPYSENALNEALKGDAPIFTEMTAAWCITCKVNHAVAINVNSTKTLFKDMDVKYFIGDWTNEDPQITKYLQSFNRSGVPLYVYYGPRDPVTKQRPPAKLLPQVLTPGVIKDYLKTP